MRIEAVRRMSCRNAGSTSEDRIGRDALGFYHEKKGARRAVNHVFMQKNPGFLTLYTMIKDALLSKVGVVKVWFEKTTREDRETYEGLSDELFTMLSADPQVEVVEHTETPSIDVMTGAPIALHDAVVVRRKEIGSTRVMAVPPEEFMISRKARNLREATFCAHRVFRTQAELIEQGFDRAQVESLPTKTYTETTEETARNTVEGSQIRGDTTNTEARLVEVIENYVKCDYEGDGVLRCYKVTTAGGDGQILQKGKKSDIECVDRMPFAAMTPIIMTHRFYGRSIADLMIEIQRINTALLRSMLDSAYLASNQRYEVSEAHASERTLDDLLANRPGGIVRVRQPGGINPLMNSDLGPHIFPLMQYIDQRGEQRTGLNKQGKALDANALQNQSATAASLEYSVAQARVKLIARIFAETGIRDVMSLLHETLMKHSMEPDNVKLRNKWVTVDPREWARRDDMTIMVGLGSGGKNEQMAHLSMIASAQEKIMMAPPLQGLVKPQNVYNLVKRMAEVAGYKNAEEFFTPVDPNQPPAPPPPDPKLQIAQMQAQQDAQSMQMKAQLDQQKAQQDAQMQAVQMQRQAAVEQAQAQADIQTQRDKANTEMSLAQQKFEFDKQLKLMDFQMKQQEREAQAAQQAQAAPAAQQQDVVGPIAHLVTGLGEQLAKHHAAHSQMVVEAINAANGPKRVIRDEAGRVVGTAPAN
jgi:hypothetical protein